MKKMILLGMLVAPAVTGAQVDQALLDQFAAVCDAKANMAAGICNCMAAKAGNTLTENSVRFLISSMSGEEAAAQAITASDPTAASAAGMFLSLAPGQCSNDR